MVNSVEKLGNPVEKLRNLVEKLGNTVEMSNRVGIGPADKKAAAKIGSFHGKPVHCEQVKW